MLLVIVVIGKPAYAYAGFFSNLVNKVMGANTEDTAIASPVANGESHNSQTIPLPESSINPDLKNMDYSTQAPVISNEAFVSNNGILGTDSELEKYDSTQKINSYIVKKGDTLEGIAKKLKVTKEVLIASNADIKKTDLLKTGQQLVIIAVKDSSHKQALPLEDSKAITKKKELEPLSSPLPSTKKPLAPLVKAKESKKTKESVVTPEPKPEVIENKVEIKPLPVDTAPVTNPILLPTTQVQTQVSLPDTSISSDQSLENINEGYIWPFPQGIGRVSQGRHADNAYDFSAPKGTPIYAVQEGSIFIAHPTGYNGGYGLYVVMNFNDGRQAIYGHMSKVAVEAGQEVKQGDIIGYVGSTGKSTGPHLHLGFHGELSNPYLGIKVNSTDMIEND